MLNARLAFTPWLAIPYPRPHLRRQRLPAAPGPTASGQLLRRMSAYLAGRSVPIYASTSSLAIYFSLRTARTRERSLHPFSFLIRGDQNSFQQKNVFKKFQLQSLTNYIQLLSHSPVLSRDDHS